MLRVFIGYDERQPVSYHVLHQSIISKATEPVSVTPLVLSTLPLRRAGLTPFTFSRFLVPWLCDYKGWALFLDIDMLLQDDIAKLFQMKDDKYAVMVSKNELKFEWASAILFNCEKCEMLTPRYVEGTQDALHRMEFVDSELVGAFPGEWNHLVGYDKERTDAKLVHYTQGVPCFPETTDSEYADEWHTEHKRVNSAYPWEHLMGPSIHSTVIDGVRVPKYKLKKLGKTVEEPSHASTR